MDLVTFIYDLVEKIKYFIESLVENFRDWNDQH